MILTLQPKALTGEITPPPSKSLAHRMIFAASMAEGVSTIENVSLSEDVEATLSAVKAMDTTIELRDQCDGRYTVKIEGGASHLVPTIDCGESGSTLRFAFPLALVRCGGGTFLGRGRLGQRPLTPYEAVCREQGIRWDVNENGLPLTIEGKLEAGTYEVRGDISSQFITGYLMALPMLEGDSVVKVKGKLESRPYVDLTLDVLQRYGIEIIERDAQTFEIAGGQHYQAKDAEVEGDWSQAAFLMVMGALGEGVTLQGMQKESRQGDRIIVDVLDRMGADMHWDGEGLTINRSKLKAVDVDLTDCPDLAPPIAAACAAAEGVSTLRGIKRLRLKESDRVESISEVLRTVGCEVTSDEDSMRIVGGMLGDGRIDAMGDHRIAMMAAVLSSVCEGDMEVVGAEAVRKSWPSFWEDFETLGGCIG